MAISLKDGASGRRARVSLQNTQVVGQQHLPASEIPAEILAAQKVLRGFFLDSAGSRDMNIVGALPGTTFEFPFAPNLVQFVFKVRFIIHGGRFNLDTPAELRRFGNAAGAGGLTNGILFFTVQGGVTTQIFSDPVQETGDFFQYNDNPGGFLNFPNGIANNVDFLSIDVSFTDPVVLAARLDTLVITIRDDLTALDLFHAVAIGTQETFEPPA